MKQKTVSYGLGLLSCLIITPGVYAGTVGDTRYYPDGWALIAGAGQNGFMTTGNYSLSASDMLKSRDARNFQFGFVGDLAIGYGRRFHAPFYLGSEVGVLFLSNTKTTAKSMARNTTIVTQTFIVDDPPLETATINHQLNTTITVSGNTIVPYFDLKPGILLSDASFLFGRIGIDYNQMKVSARSNYIAAGQVVNTRGDLVGSNASASLMATHKKQLAGLRTGLGFEYLLTENVGLSANYVYAFYSSLSTSASGSSDRIACDVVEGCPIRSDGTYSAAGRSKMGDQQVLLELNYHLT